MSKLSTLQIRPLDGGHLITRASADIVGPANYVRKVDMRREDDAEVPREGWVPFAPNAGILTDQSTITATGPILGMWENVRPNGERKIVAATKTKIFVYQFSTGTWVEIGTGFSSSTTWWQGESTDGNLVLNNGIDLPQVYRNEWNSVRPLYELREIGVASVKRMAVWNGFLIFGDVTEIASAYLATQMNSGTPYGIVTSAQTNRVRYKIVWSDYTQPTNFAPVITGTIQTATKNKVTLAYVPHNWAVGTKVAVIGAGLNGGTLGGEEGFEDGVPITDITGNIITLGESADASLTYPLTVSVTRWADTSTFSGYSDVQDDSSAIVAIKPLKQTLIVYRETGIFTGRFTGNVESPFVFTPAYRGAEVPAHPRAIADLVGDAHVYPTKNDFVAFDGTGNPTTFKTLSNVSDLFFGSGLADDTGFVVHNAPAKEFWFQGGLKVVAYDYLNNEASEVNEAIAAGVSCAKPDANYALSPSTHWFVYVPQSTVTAVTYGLTSTSSLGTYTRGNVAVAPYLTFGAFTGNNLVDQKILRSYSVITEPAVGNVAASVTLYGVDSVAQLVGATPVVDAEPITQTDVLPQLEMCYRNVVFQDKITFTGPLTNSFRFTGRTMTVLPGPTRGVTRSYNGSS